MNEVRVVQVVPHMSPGGMQEVATALNDGLPACGIDSEILDLRAETQGYEYRRGGGRRPGRFLRSWSRLVARWRRDRVDSVLAHTAYNAAYSLSAAFAAGVPRRIVVIHSDKRTLGALKSLLLSGLCRLKLATDVVYVGFAVSSSFRLLMLWSGVRSHVVQNGARTLVSSPEAKKALVGPVHVVTASRLVPGKNLAVVVEAVSLTKFPLVLDICGDGPELGTLEKRAADLGVRAAFHGHLDRYQLAEVYEQASLFLFPTKGEGLPLVLIEAAASGLAVVASDYPFNWEVMQDAAVYCPPDDAGAWAEAIDEMLADPAVRSRAIAKGYDRADHFTIDRMVRDYADLLRHHS